MKILLTGFDPFGGEKINPAWEAVKKVRDEIKGSEIIKLQIPTVFGKGPKKIEEKIEEINPDVVLSIGQAGSRSCVSVEYVGVNVRVARIPDNEGNEPMYEKIQEDGEDGYISNLPVPEIVENVKKAGLPAYVSFTAGAYVCNDVLYSIRYLGERKFKGLKSGFIHVPFIAEQVIDKPAGTPFMSKEDIVKSIEIALETIIEENK